MLQSNPPTGQPPREEDPFLTRAMIRVVWFWQVAFSAWMAPSCRFLPSCSDYAVQAIREHGPLAGAWLTLRRVGRCHPFGGSGIDEVPHCANPNNPLHHGRCQHSEPSSK